jgi:hypothetical protein
MTTSGDEHSENAPETITKQQQSTAKDAIQDASLALNDPSTHSLKLMTTSGESESVASLLTLLDFGDFR